MRIRRGLVALLTGVMLGAGAPVVMLFSAPPAGASGASTTLVSAQPGGGSGNDASQDEAISANGRYVAFASWASNLVSGDTNGSTDVFVRDLVAGSTERVSVASDGTQGDDFSDQPSISADGRYVAFQSDADNLVPGDANGRSDVFVRDRVAGTTERVSVSSAGAQGDDDSSDWSIPGPSISADGRYVAFASYAHNLVGSDTNYSADIFVRDRLAGTTERVSVNSSGTEADVDSFGATISGDGRYVSFMSWATNLVPDDTNPFLDVFVRDRVAGTTERVSVASGGAQGNDRSYSGGMSADGRYVSFMSWATNLVPDDTNGHYDVFVHDRATGGTARVSLASDGAQGNGDALAPMISDDGRYVVFASEASNLVSDDTNGYWDVFVHDAVTGTTDRVDVATDGTQGNFGGGGAVADISADGRVIVFDSSSNNLVADDSNGTWDVFVRQRSVPPHITRPRAELYGHRLTGGYASDPVNTAIGNFTQTDSDLTFPDGVFGLNWRRTYNSLDTTSGALGVGWSSGFGAHVAEAPDGSVVFTDWDGRQITFHPLTGGGWDRPEELFGDLHRDLDGILSVVFFSGQTWDFDVSGRLAAEGNWDGQTVTFAYDSASRLTSATSSAGYALTFTYDAFDRIIHVASSDGRAVSYTYGPSGALATATDPAGGTTLYLTDTMGRITAITDPDGRPVIANTYDTEGRIATQTTPSSDTVTFAYNDGTGVTTVNHSGRGAVVSYAHDHDGRLTQITDPYGALLSKTYDGVGNQTGVVDRRGAGTTQTFDGHGNLLSRFGPGGVSEAFTYDSADRLATYTNGENETTTFTYQGAERLPSTMTDGTSATTTFDVGTDGLVHSETDGDGVTLVLQYDAGRNLVSVTDEANKVTTYAYDAAGNRTSATTPLGHNTSWTYDGQRRVLSRTDPLGAVARWTWTPGGRLASSTDETGATTTLAYDNAGRLWTLTDPLASVTTFGYDVDGNLTSVTRPGNAIWSATYDKLGRRLSETDATGVTTSYGYDADGNLTATTDENNHTTNWTYDLRGRATARTDPLGHTTSFGYDLADRLTSMTDPAGTTAWTYDNAGRRISETDARSQHWAWTYTPAGRLESATDPNLHTTSHTYDPVGRLDTTTDPEGGITHHSFDADGRLTAVTSPAGLTTTYQYDTRSRLTRSTNHAGVAERRTYTARDELASVADGTGDAARFAYDPAGRLIKATDRNGGFTIFAYDPRGNLTTRTDPNGGVERWTWDLADRLLTRSDQLNRTTTMSYDNLGRPASIADPSGRSVTFGYDAAGQLTSRTFGDNSVVSYGYDPAGRRTSMVDTTGTTTYGYDPVGNLTSVTTSDGKTLTSAYDPAGRRSTLTYPDGQAATYSYDDANRLVGVTHPEGAATTYTRDADGRLLTEAVAGGPSRTWSYASGRLVTYTETNGTTTKTTTLGYDDDGRIATETTGGATKTFRYDAAGQLTKMTRPGQLNDTTYTYDRAGNRLSEATGLARVTFTYDPANELTANELISAVRTNIGVNGTSFSGWQFRYDGAGRLTQARSDNNLSALAPTPEDVQQTIQYDARGLAANVTTDRTSLGVTRTWQTTRTYDGDGTLRSATSTSPTNTTTTTSFNWDLLPAIPQIATETVGTSETDFLYGDERIAALRGGQADPFSYDAHGSTLAAEEATDLAAGADYDPFGRPDGDITDIGLLGLTSNQAGDHTPRFGYRGELHLDGLIHLRARDYNPGAGRFTTPDPLQATPGRPTVGNPYPYAANDPLNKIDPLGLSPVKDGDLRGSGVIYGPPAPQPIIRGWDYTEDGLVDAILAYQAGRYDPTVVLTYNYASGPGYQTRRISGSQYLKDLAQQQLTDAQLDASIASHNAELHARLDGYLWQKLALAGGAGGSVLVGACGAFWEICAPLLPPAISGVNRGADRVQGPFGSVARSVLETAAQSGGSTTRVVTNLTESPTLGRAVSVATGDAAEALAAQARSTGTYFAANIPNALIDELRAIGLAKFSTTEMGGIVGTEIRFLPAATEFILRFFSVG